MTEKLEGLPPLGDMSLEELVAPPRAMPEWGVNSVDSISDFAELLEASRGIVIDSTEGYKVKLSKCTLRQLSRANPIRRGCKRSGKHLRKVRQRKAYQTKRKEKRLYNLKLEQQFYQLRQRYGERWQVSKEAWLQEVGPYVEGNRLRVGVYDRKAPVTLENLWIENSRSGAKLWEGAEEQLRRLGYGL